jgi:hypothetical protein
MREAILTIKYDTATAAASGGTIIQNTVFSQSHSYNGFIEQISVRAVTGGGANFAIQLRGDETSSNVEDLYVNLSGQAYGTLINIKKPFDTRRMTDEDLSIWLNPATTGTFIIRIEFRILGRFG